MRAVLSLPPVLALATLSASCPHPQRASLLEAPSERAEATLGAKVRALGDRASRSIVVRAVAVEVERAPTDVNARADADPDEGSASAWGVPALPRDLPSLPDPTSGSPEIMDVPAPDAQDAKSESDPVAWVNDLAAGASEKLFTSRGPKLVSIAKETWVFEKPQWKSRRIGYLRAGASVGRSDDAVGYQSCKGGWYAVEPRGYVCVNAAASLDPNHPVAILSRTRPKMDGLPYGYVIARIPGPPMYAHVPSDAEQRKVETDLGFHLRQAKALEHDKDFVAPPDPEAMWDELSGDRALPGLGDEAPRSPTDLLLGRAKPRAGFALLTQFDVGGRRFGLTTQLFVVPLDRTRWISGSTFHGIELGDDVTLPVAFVMKHHAKRFEGDDAGHRHPGAELGFREAVPLSGRTSADGQFYEAKDGSWVRAEDVRRIDPMHRAPVWAVPGRKWVDVSILKQALVAYEGKKPVYVTLVSTGADGLGDPKKTHSTIQGVFLIHTKHVTVTMDNDEKDDEFDLRDVPFVQYFTEGYALHAAYWHDDFGTPRSHGCVNMAPIDAAWMFGFTTPEVPKGWHAAMSLKKGTLVHTHP